MAHHIRLAIVAGWGACSLMHRATCAPRQQNRKEARPELIACRMVRLSRLRYPSPRLDVFRESSAASALVSFATSCTSGSGNARASAMRCSRAHQRSTRGLDSRAEPSSKRVLSSISQHSRRALHRRWRESCSSARSRARVSLQRDSISVWNSSKSSPPDRSVSAFVKTASICAAATSPFV